MRTIIALNLLILLVCLSSSLDAQVLRSEYLQADTTAIQQDSLKTKRQLRSGSIEDSRTAFQRSTTLPSPHSMNFRKYQDHEISEYNGLANIEIPLYEIEIKGLKIPITLTYHSSGVKFKQHDGDVGAGWSVLAGGYRVSRTVNNKPDESTEFFSKDQLDRLTDEDKETYYADMCYPQVGFTGAQGLRHINDGEYDLFTYSTPTTGGSFVIADRSDKKNLKIGFLDQARNKVKINTVGYYPEPCHYIESVNLIDDKGFNYYFGGSAPANDRSFIEESPNPGHSCFDRHYTAWTLAEIQSPFNDEKIQFSYIKSNAYSSQYRQQTVVDAHQLITTQYPYYHCVFDGEYQSRTFADDKGGFLSPASVVLLVSQIESDNEIVEFKRYSRSEDENLEGNIKEIQIISKHDGSLFKKIQFVYEKIYPHVLLSSIVEYGSTPNVKGNTHQFDYYKDIDNIVLLSSDQWGYYVKEQWPRFFHEEFNNGMFYWKSPNPEACYEEEPLTPGEQPLRIEVLMSEKLGDYDLGGYLFNRSENNGTSHLLSLKKITFPTGGTTSYEYEPNEYYDFIKDKKVKGGGHRIKTITSNPQDGSLPVATEFKYGVNEDGIGYVNFNLDWRSFGDETHHVVAKDVFFIGAGDVLQVDIAMYLYTERTFSTIPMGTASTNLFCISYPEVSVYRYQLKDFVYTYNGKTASNYLQDNRYYADNIGAEDTYSQASILSNGYSPLNIVGYSPARKPNISSRTLYDKNNRMVQSEEFRYKYLPIKQPLSNQAYYSGVKVSQYLFIHNKDEGFRHTDQSKRKWGETGGHYRIQATSYYSGEFVLEQKNTTLYNSGSDGYITTSEDCKYDDKDYYLYNYDDHNNYNYNNRLLSHSKSTGLGGRTLETKYTYPSSGSELEKRNMLSTIVKTETLNSGLSLSKVENIYNENSVLPSSAVTTINGDWRNVRTSVAFDKYDIKGNLLQYTGIDGLPVSYLWSYNYKYPVVEIKNADYKQVSEIMGENKINDIAKSKLLNLSDSILVNSLRDKLPNAFITSYTYKPFVGMTTATDPRGVTNHYSYDSFGRLRDVKDADKKTINQYDYHYFPYEVLSLEFTGNNLVFAETNKVAIYTAKASGGSGKYMYSFSAIDSDGVEVASIQNSPSSELSVTFKKVGIAKITATVIDTETKQTETITNSIEVQYPQFKIAVDCGVFKPLYLTSETVTFEAKASGGSGKYSAYTWTITNATTGEVLDRVENSPSNKYTIEKLGVKHKSNLKATCEVKDLETGEEEIGYQTIHVASLKISMNNDLSGYFLNEFERGIFTVTASGGSGSYSYSWYVAGQKSINSKSNTHLVSLGGGHYTIRCVVKDNLKNEEEEVSMNFGVRGEVIGIKEYIDYGSVDEAFPSSEDDYSPCVVSQKEFQLKDETELTFFVELWQNDQENEVSFWVGSQEICTLSKVEPSKNHFYNVSLPAGNYEIKICTRNLSNWSNIEAQIMITDSSTPGVSLAPDNRVAASYYGSSSRSSKPVSNSQSDDANLENSQP